MTPRDGWITRKTDQQSRSGMLCQPARQESGMAYCFTRRLSCFSMLATLLDNRPFAALR
jgi:hypothetical protein